MADHTTGTIPDLKPLCNQNELKLSSGICNLYWWIVQNSASIAALLNKKLKKEVQKTFSPLKIAVYDALVAPQDKLILAPEFPLPKQTDI